MKKEDYTINDFLDIIKSYNTMIIRSSKEYPTVVLYDIYSSTKGILKLFNYEMGNKNEK